MTRAQARHIAEFIAPPRVTPGARARLEQGFDPAYRADFLRNKNGRRLL